MGIFSGLFGKSDDDFTSSEGVNVQTTQIEQNPAGVEKRKNDLDALMQFENKLKQRATERGASEVPESQKVESKKEPESALTIQNPFRGE